jgi:hypothetical protein
VQCCNAQLHLARVKAVLPTGMRRRAAAHDAAATSDGPADDHHAPLTSL